MGIKFTNVTMIDCGTGFHLEGDVHLNVDGLKAERVGTLVVALKHAPMMNRLGLPSDTNPLHLAQLLSELREAEDSERATLARHSGLLDSILKKGQDITSIANNIATLAASPMVQAIIDSLHT